MRPRPKKRGQSWRKGASIKTKNLSLKCDFTLFYKDFMKKIGAKINTLPRKITPHSCPDTRR
jgi:hypothetical protein